MKKILFHQFGNASQLSLEEVSVPIPASDELLIRVKAASCNPVDRGILSGNFPGLDPEFPKGMGLDFAGTVEGSGSQVSKFQLGDEVYGWMGYGSSGSFSEYVVAPQAQVFMKPSYLSFEEAACLPLVGATAYNALILRGKLKQGQSVFIHGCTGGVGQLAVQIAKHFGAYVIGTCSLRTQDLARIIGADEVYEYRKLDLKPFAKRADIALVTGGKLDFEDILPILKSKGVFTDIRPKNHVHPQYRQVITAPVTQEMLNAVNKIAHESQLKLIIGERVSLQQAIPTLIKLEQGKRASGKTVLVM
ncbi:NADP-dependent oxidoreductase [Pontibacter sp. G13]|uniref:NADP-dependent oxidoreductase n=1 Tax=Pontibacter sp. G13 TaxID=3074898 RepID=UPI00288A3268|nr:NADP-dependent oxidoreductase [Pontibacter sp. G13]WNJ20498.1 NADP-dependent oxidoreductase [Pontibacter sp. G13]